MKKIGYYIVRIVIWAFSLIPFWLLYAFSDFLSKLFYYVIPYRKKLIIKNLKISFPEKSNDEINEICKDFYKNLSDILLEGLKGFSMSEEQVVKRYTIEKNQMIDDLYQQGKSIMITTAHMTNWEWGVSATGLYFKHLVFGVYKKLNHADINKYIEGNRARYNIHLSEMQETAKMLSTDHNLDPFAIVLIADQRPANPKKAFWTYFLNQESAFFYGAEKFALEYNYPVFFFNITRMKRGYYNVNIELLSENPADLEKGELIRRYRDVLEREIKKRPADWLWSHNRWKHKRPEGMPIQA